MQFDQFSNQQSDLIGSDPDNNTVGYVGSQLYTPSDDSAGVAALSSLSNSTGGTSQAAKQEATFTKQEQQSPLGSPFNSPIGWVNHIMGIANYYKGAGAGNEYTNGFEKPQKNLPLQATKPEEYYAHWYNLMREYSQAEEVADKGQSQVRTR
jgi:hypothetical protein